MAEASIPVDLFNPGQVFACLGFLEAAEVLLGQAEGYFDWIAAGQARFHLRGAGNKDPITETLGFLGEASVRSLRPVGSSNRTEPWGVPSEAAADGCFPGPEPASPATLPALLVADGAPGLRVDHWADGSRRDTVKFWAGSGGYPGAALLRDALDLVRGALREPNTADGPFEVAASQPSSFRFDWRRDYVPIDAGFSPNDHGDVVMRGYPLVEVLAAVGLSNARPGRASPGSKLAYRYGVVRGPRGAPHLDPVILRAALGCAPLPFDQRFFRLTLGWPGKEGQARCITGVTEFAKEDPNDGYFTDKRGG